ncbi:hypothetical protein [Kitasatospora sp. NBC_01302]|uniref:hypothetical protein n=1 Tax=Kitasatospora sp. NBC_01302 TaxID=2903575 RepID=UPI002E159752|nr:hypothetical protein OG294_24775 [Kitasatospora sp. NBC_01302]
MSAPSFDEAFAKFQDEFPDVCLTYWERWELEEYATDEDDEQRKLTEFEWLRAKDVLVDAVYEVVSSNGALSESAGRAVGEAGAR